MKSITILLLAGLALATQQEGGAQAAAGNETDVQQGGEAAVEAGNNSTAGADANAEAGKQEENNNNNNDNNNEENNAGNAADVIQVQNGQQCVNLEALNDPNFDPASLNLGAMQLGGGLNLGNINLADPVSLAFGIDSLMNNFCLGQLVDLNTLLALGVQNQQQMFLELAQIAQLQQLGLVDVFGAQNLIQSNLVFGGAFNLLNAGIIKREPGKKPANLRERRDDMIKRQCNVAQAGQAANIQNLPPCQAENNDQQNQDQQNQDEQNQDEQNADEQNADEQNADEQNADEQNADEQNADEQNADEQNADEQNADEQNADEQNAEEQKAEEQNAEDAAAKDAEAAAGENAEAAAGENAEAAAGENAEAKAGEQAEAAAGEKAA